MNSANTFQISAEDWFNLGKSDAWAGRSKSPPEGDVEAASLYDLGFSEGAIQRSPLGQVMPCNANFRP